MADNYTFNFETEKPVHGNTKSKKYKMERSKKILEESGYTIINCDIFSMEIIYKCSNGHIDKKKVPVSSSKKSEGCKICYYDKMKNEMIKKVKDFILIKNGLWLNGNYDGINSKGTFRCGQCGHKWETRFANILEGKWCRKCAKAYNAKCTKAAAVFRKLNKEIQYYHSRQNVFDDINREIKETKKSIKKSKAWIEKKRLEANKKYRPKSKKSYAYKYNNVPEFRLNELIKAQIKKCMVKGNKMGKYYEILGYTTKELYTHLESKFTEGMSWENMGEWHIDHIIPKSWFKLTKEDGTLDKEQFKKCWSLDNLQPLWEIDNIKKGNRYAG